MTSGAREGRPLAKLIALSLFVNDANVGPRVAAVKGVCVRRKALVPLACTCCVSVTRTQVYRSRVWIAQRNRFWPFVRRRTRDHVKPGVRPACGLLRLNCRSGSMIVEPESSSFWKRPVAKVSKSPKRDTLSKSCR